MQENIGYDINEMLRFMKSLDFSKKKRKKEICVAGIEMYLLTQEDILYILNNGTSEEDASKFLHKKIMEW